VVDSAYLIEVTWNLLLVGFLVFLNGFFVAAEFAIVKVRETQLLQSKGPRAATALHVVRHLDAYLSACQLGITIASLGLGWVGEPAVAHLIVEPLVGKVVTNPETVRGISLVLAFLVIIALHIVIGELAPKGLAIRAAKRTTLWTAVPLRTFRIIFSPLIWLLNGAANLILRLIGIQPVTSGESEHTIDELRILLARSHSKEKTQRQSAEVASRVFGLMDLEVRDIMVPRDRMVALDVQRTFEANLLVVEGHPFTRYPVSDGGPDSILGFVHQRDVFAAAKRDPKTARLQDLLRDVHVVPGSQAVSRAMFDMLDKRRPMTIVVNEFGTTVGLLTLEDIFEELVGDIPSEFERADPRLRVVAAGHYVVDASMPLHELQVILREPLPERGAATLAGLLNNHLGRIPVKGENVHIGNYGYWVKEADRRRARLVEIRRQEPTEEPATGGPTEPAPAPP
jgi:CBS domain containing-hemolysin-like protein